MILTGMFEGLKTSKLLDFILRPLKEDYAAERIIWGIRYLNTIIVIYYY